MVLRDLHAFYFWAHSGSKIEKQVLVFKGLTKRNHKTKEHTWKESFLVTYKWLRKTEGKLLCVCCCKFPQYSHKSMELAKGFSGNADGLNRKRLRDMPSIISVKSTKNTRMFVIKWVSLRLWTRVFRKWQKNLEKNELCAIFFLPQTWCVKRPWQVKIWTLIAKLCVTQIDELEEQTILGTQGVAAYSTNMRITQAAAVWDIIRSSVL
jgi:hypothetical protein